MNSWSIPKKRLTILVIAGLTSFYILYKYYTATINFADQALGDETSRYLAVKDSCPIHAVELSTTKVKAILQCKRNFPSTVFILGNSQTHSINQIKPGQNNYVEQLAGNLDLNVICQSIPNGNLQEFWLLVNYWYELIHFDKLIIPVFMDDLREDGIRINFIEALCDAGFKLKDDNDLSKSINISLDESCKVNSIVSEDLKRRTTQEIVEHSMDTWLNKHSKLWMNRENARGQLFLGLYNLRNTIFRINASTTRKMIPSRYDRNMESLRLILQFANNHHIPTLIYIPPIRNDVSKPYDPEEYAVMKERVYNLAGQYSAQFFNFEDIVPGKLWGFKTSTNLSGEKELDFMHFQYEGHRILGDSLHQYIQH